MPKERPGLRRQIEQGLGAKTSPASEAPVSHAHAKGDATSKRNTDESPKGYARGQVSFSTALGSVAAAEADRVNTAAGMDVISASNILGKFLREYDEELAQLLRHAITRARSEKATP